MKQRDFKKPDAPKAEPLTYQAFADKLAALADKLEKVNEAIKRGGEAVADYADRKEQTP